jgi:mono/diheme cytochrome c family protein
MFSVNQTWRRVALRAAAAVFAVGLAACSRNAHQSEGGANRLSAGHGVSAAAPSAGPSDRVKRGEYLVAITACSDCHTPMKVGPKGPEPDMSRFLGGHPQEVKMPPAPQGGGPWLWHGSVTNTAFAGPWGVTYAINLTPHTHGMAAWTEDMFVRAMRTGKHMGESRPIQPPMPWPSFAKMTDEDLKSIYAYLKTVPPVNNIVPDYLPPGK